MKPYSYGVIIKENSFVDSGDFNIVEFPSYLNENNYVIEEAHGENPIKIDIYCTLYRSYVNSGIFKEVDLCA